MRLATPRQLVLAASVCALLGALVWALLVDGAAPASNEIRRERGRDDGSAASISPVRAGVERASVTSLVTAAAPEASLESKEASAASGRSGVIRGFVRPSTAVDLTRMRVVAVPREWSSLAHMPLRSCIETPEAHGLLLAECDVDGAFTIGPGLDPAVEYAIVAAGEGEAARAPFEERYTAGASVEVQTQPVVGLRIRVEGETGEGLDWSDRVSVPVGLVPTGRGTWGPTQEVLPDPISRALLRIPGFRDSSTEFIACMFGGPGGREVEVAVHTKSHGAPEHFDVVLQPVGHGLEVKTLVVEGAVVRHEPVTIHFPPDVAEALRACDWPVEVWFDPGKAMVARLEPDCDSWTTTGVAPGTYRVQVHAWINQRFFPEVYGARSIRVGDEPVELWLPRSLTAAVAEFPFSAAEKGRVAIKCPFRAHMPRHALYSREGAEIAVPLIWDSARAEAPEFELSLHPHGARVPLLDHEGRTAITPAPRERIRLAHGRPEPVEPPRLPR